MGAIGNCPTGQISGTTVNANHTSEVSCDNNYQCNWVDVYYTITTPASGYVKFIPGTGTPAATFYSGSCGALVSEACLTAEGNASLVGNATYFVKISTLDDNNNYPNGEGKAFIFCLEEAPPPPANNECTGAIGISVSANGACSDVVGTTAEAGSDDFLCPVGSNSSLTNVWYSFVGPAGGAVTFHSGTGSPLATIYSGDCNNLALQDFGCINGNGTVTGLVASSTYYLQIFTTSSGVFDFCLEIPSAAPANDLCGGAIAADLGNPIDVNSIYATVSFLPGCVPAAQYNIPDMWYSITGPASGVIEASFQNGTLPFSLYSGTCGSLDTLACASPLTGDPPMVTTGTPYFIQIHSLGATDTGIFTIISPNDFTFTGAVNNNWNEGSNWKSGTVPTGSEAIIIPNGAFFCNLDTDVTLTGSITLESGGVFSIPNGSTLTNNGIITDNGTLINQGILAGSGTFNGNYINPVGGILAPGNSAGCMSYANDFENLGTIEIEIGGTGGSCPTPDFDIINVTGDMAFGGILTVTLINGFIPIDGNTFQIITAGGTFSGDFVTENFPTVSGISFSFDETTGILSAATALPISLVDFQVRKQEDNTVLLNWITSAEINNEGFSIERNLDGKGFETIGWVDGFGNTDQMHHYQFLDKQVKSGINYYRLKQMDYDGAFEYSNIVSVQLTDGNSQLSVYPNPVRNNSFSVSFSDQDFESGELSIYDSMGRLVQSHNILNTETEIQTGDLAKGIYLVSLEMNGQRFLERIIVQ